MTNKGKYWIKTQRNDKYYKLSKKEKHRARSYYKIKQIDEKYDVFHIGGRHPKRILDLGAAPGAWLEYIKDEYEKRPLELKSKKFKVIGVDLTTIKPFEDANNIETLDIFKQECDDLLSKYQPFDMILSDLAPKTTGDFRDIAIQSSMVEMVISYAIKYLKKQGNIVIKIFQSAETDKIVHSIKNRFNLLKRIKPSSSRESSRELYLVGLGFRRE